MASNPGAATIARLSSIEHLLFQRGEKGMSLDELAAYLETSKRSVQRDLKLIEEEDIFPLWHERGRCGIITKRYLPPIRFEPLQALNVFLAARLMASYAHSNDPGITAIFTKLNCVMQSPLKEQIEKTIEWMKTLPAKEKTIHNLNLIGEAWNSGQKVRIKYQSADASQPDERIISPYFIQPAGQGHSAYVIAYCHKHNDIRIFKIERISSAFLTGEKYSVPDTFDANRYLASAWDIMVGDETSIIKLRVDKKLVRFMQETTWHHSQKLEMLPDGSALMTINVSNTSEIVPWIMGWGDGVEVLEPEELRNALAGKARAIANLYAKKSTATC